MTGDSRGGRLRRMGGGLKTLGGTVLLTRGVWRAVGVIVVSGCSSFICGLDRTVGRLKTRIAMGHGSRFQLRRLRRFSGVLLSPNPNIPRRTNLLLSIVHECTKGGPVLKIYLNRRTVNRICKKGLAGLSRIFRNVRDPIDLATASCLFGKLPSAMRMKECRS